jgi:hypothetical protein
MVRFPAARQAAELARSHPELAMGLHFDLGEWSFDGNAWRSVYTVADDQNEKAVEAEVASQLAEFRRLMGCNPTHIDSHQHVHWTQPTRRILRNAAKELGIPLRGVDGISYRGDFYGQTAKGEPALETITVQALIDFLASLQPGTTELGCHPGLEDPTLRSMYSVERPIEVRTLCDPRVREAIDSNGIALRSFADV